MAQAMEEACEPKNLLLDIRKRLDEIEDSVAGEADFIDQKTLMPRTIERIFGKRQPAIPTGLDELDKITLGGIRAGELWIVGGLPGRAKTSLARAMGRTASKNGIPVRVQTIEMPDTDWNALDVAFEAGIPAWKLRNPNFISREDKDALYKAIELVQCWPMTVDDAGSIHIRQLIAKARLAVRKRGTRLLIVDYVQRIKSDDKEVRHRIGNSAGELAEFAKETGCAVILLSQLSRQGDINIRPTMQHLKESGELEAHAHTILLNYRPVENVAGKEIFTGEDEIIVAKQRYGPIGSIRVAYNSDLLTFVGR